MVIPKYPDDFYSFAHGVFVDNNTINEWIKKCIDYLEANKDINHCSTGSGRIEIHVVRYVDEYYISVAQNYSTASIRFE